MMKFLRSQSQTVLTIVLGVIGLGFLFYGSSGTLITSQGTHLNNDYGRVGGENLSVAELYAAVRNTRLSLIMRGQSEQLSQPGAAAQVAEEAWRQLLLLNEADKLHIVVTDKELETYIRNQPIFQKDGFFSPEVYRQVLSQIQTILRLPTDTTPGQDPLTSTATAVETVMRNDLQANAVSAALFSTVRSSVKDVSSQYEKFYGPATVSYVTLDPKVFIDAVQVTPQAIEAEYKANPMNPAYRSPEKRKVDYVLFQLTPDQAKLPADEKKAAMEAIGQKALDFALAFQPDPSAQAGSPVVPPPDFLTEAKKRGLNPATTDFFSTDTPPANVPPSPSFNNTAFSLTKESPISKLVDLDNGIAVLHLVEIQPSDLLPLDQVKPAIVKQLQQTQGQLQGQLAAVKAKQDLKDAVAKGTDFKIAAANLKLKIDSVPAFVPIKVPQSDQKMQTIAYISSTLAPGEVSDAIPLQSDNTQVIVHLESRGTADPAGLPDFQKNYRNREDEQLRSLVYADWADWEGKQPGMRKPPQLEAFGAVQ